ncbi:hypothetical protein NDU88_005186 [Pleurodeles waltl]|uniref:Uncharacterized protein n=1 Tax=Pleurodeles waltl TaxID=8319 RepID=A0AAV7MX35_PLEWA|nr:hypothetical protein NDU88_005186 [Pleurodeles waltl]
MRETIIVMVPNPKRDSEEMTSLDVEYRHKDTFLGDGYKTVTKNGNPCSQGSKRAHTRSQHHDENLASPPGVKREMLVRGALVDLEIENAFHSLSWENMFEVLATMGFSPKYPAIDNTPLHKPDN